MPKTASAQTALSELNPEIAVSVRAERLHGAALARAVDAAVAAIRHIHDGHVEEGLPAIPVAVEAEHDAGFEVLEGVAEGVLEARGQGPGCSRALGRGRIEIECEAAVEAIREVLRLRLFLGTRFRFGPGSGSERQQEG